MAEIGKYCVHSVGRLLLHNNRQEDDGVYHSNEDIDNSRTHLNYHLKKGTSKDVAERLSQVFSTGRKEQVVLAEVVLTLPKDVKPEDELRFFQSAYNFYANDFGTKNIINAVIHKDEATPHMHLDFVPVVKEDVQFEKSGPYGKGMNKKVEMWKETHPGELERLNCKKLISKEYLQDMHTRLSDHIERDLGYHTSVLNGATQNGNKTVAQLKLESLQKEVEKLEMQKANLMEDVRRITQIAEQNGMSVKNVDLVSLMQTIEDLRIQNEVLQDIIRRNDCMYTRDEMTLVNEHRIYSKSSKLNVVNDSFAWASFDKDSVVITETYNQIRRPQPYAGLFASSPEFAQALQEAHMYRGNVYKKKLEKRDLTLVIVKSDNEVQTFEALLELERVLRENALKDKKIYMGRLEHDKFDNGREVLSRTYSEAFYYVGKDTSRNSDGKEYERLKN